MAQKSKDERPVIDPKDPHAQQKFEIMQRKGKPKYSIGRVTPPVMQKRFGRATPEKIHQEYPTTWEKRFGIDRGRLSKKQGKRATHKT